MRALTDRGRELAIGETSEQTYRTSMDRMRARNQVLIGIHVDSGGSPTCFRRAPDQQPEGFDVALAHELTRRIAVELALPKLEAVLVPSPWPAILEQPARHTVDFVIASVTASPERAARHQLAFTSPYHQALTTLVYRGLPLPRSFRDGGHEREELAKYELGVMAGTTAAAYLDDLGIDPRVVPTLDELARLLADGEIDGAVCDSAQSAAFDEPYETLELCAKRQQYALALAPLNRELMREINRYLAELDADVRTVDGRELNWFEREIQAASDDYVEIRREARHVAIRATAASAA